MKNTSSRKRRNGALGGLAAERTAPLKMSERGDYGGEPKVLPRSLVAPVEVA
jgi:hypothetical protein